MKKHLYSALLATSFLAFSTGSASAADFDVATGYCDTKLTKEKFLEITKTKVEAYKEMGKSLPDKGFAYCCVDPNRYGHDIWKMCVVVTLDEITTYDYVVHNRKVDPNNIPGLQ